jgi:L-ascorbate metabolism protein UlaG (beta-lactamase superfamily)
MRLTHLGHSCVLVEAGEVRVLLDPGTYSHGFEELTDLDAIVITHGHVDHLDAERLPTLLEANDGVRIIAEPEVATELTGVGLDTTALHPGETLQLAGTDLRAVGGDHAVVHPDIPRIGNVGVLISCGDGPVFFHPGDAYDTAPEGVDVLALPLAAPWAALRETVDFLRAVAPRVAVPIHDGMLAPGGRQRYIQLIGGLSPEGTQLRDLSGGGGCEV